MAKNLLTDIRTDVENVRISVRISVETLKHPQLLLTDIRTDVESVRISVRISVENLTYAASAHGYPYGCFHCREDIRTDILSRISVRNVEIPRISADIRTDIRKWQPPYHEKASYGYLCGYPYGGGDSGRACS